MILQFTRANVRLLTEAELDRISGGQGAPDATVIGYRNARGDIIGFGTGTSGSEPPPFEQDAASIEPTLEPQPQLDPIVVRISIRPPTDPARADQAARRLIGVLAQILRNLNLVNATTEFRVAGAPYTLQKVIDDIINTDYVVSDITKDERGNGGVGAAVFGQNGARHVNEINLEEIMSGYGRPTDNLGLVSLLFHDLGHNSVPGFDFRVLNIQYYDGEPQVHRGPWISSEYFQNIERFANDFLVAATSAAQITHGGIPQYGVGAVDPASIYARRSAGW